MLASAIVTPVRQALNDASAVRWTNAALFQYLYEGEKQIAGKHPESQYIVSVINPTPTLCTALTDTLTLETSWDTALVHYVCSRAFGEDADDSGNMKLSQQHFALYQEAMK